jgi:hypothetical protein
MDIVIDEMSVDEMTIDKITGCPKLKPFFPEVF